MMNKTRERHMIIRFADASGKLGREEEDGGENTDRSNAKTKIIDTDKREDKRENGRGGGHLQRICTERHMAPMATWGKQRQPYRDRWGNTNNERTWEMESARKKPKKIPRHVGNPRGAGAHANSLHHDPCAIYGRRKNGEAKRAMECRHDSEPTEQSMDL